MGPWRGVPTAEILVRSLVSQAADRKTFELVAERVRRPGSPPPSWRCSPRLEAAPAQVRDAVRERAEHARPMRSRSVVRQDLGLLTGPGESGGVVGRRTKTRGLQTQPSVAGHDVKANRASSHTHHPARSHHATA